MDNHDRKGVYFGEAFFVKLSLGALYSRRPSSFEFNPYASSADAAREPAVVGTPSSDEDQTVDRSRGRAAGGGRLL